MTALPRLGKGGLNDVPEHGSEACGRVLVGVVVRAAAVDLGFVTLGSTPMLSVGGPVSGQSSLSHRANVLMTDCSRFFRGPPSFDRVLEGRECDYSWWEWQAGVGCFGEWLRGAGLWLSMSVGPRIEPFSKVRAVGSDSG